MVADLEPGERRLALAAHWEADDNGNVSTVVTIKDLDALELVQILGELVTQVPALIDNELRADNPRLSLLEGQLAVEKQRADTLAHQHTEARTALEHERGQRLTAQQELRKAETRLEEQKKRPEVAVERGLREDTQRELERARAEIARLTTKLAEDALASPNG